MDFSFLNTAELRTFIETFNTVAQAHSNDNVDARALRTVLAGTKATIDQALVEFPKSYITNVVKDVQDLIVSKEAAEAVSATVRSLDSFKILELVEEAKAALSTPETTREIAAQLKKLLNQAPSTSELGELLDNLPVGDTEQVKTIFDAIISPMIDQARGSSEAEIAQQVTMLIDMIPSGDIAIMGGQITETVTPDVVRAAARDLINNTIPSPSEIAEVVHDLGNAASAAIGEAIKSASKEEILGTLAAFVENAGSIVEKALSHGNKQRAENATFKDLGFNGFPGFDPFEF